MCKYAMVNFYSESREDNVLPSTIRTEEEMISRALDQMSETFGVKVADRNISGLSGEVLQRWVNGMKKRGLKPATINLYIAAINPFLRWAHTMTSGGECVPYLKAELGGVLKALKLPDPDKIPPEQRLKTKYYSNEEVEELLNVKGSHNKLRDQAIIALTLGSGLRVSELCSLTIGSVLDRPQGTVFVRRKGGAWKEAEVADFAYEYIRKYLETRDCSDHSAPLFTTREGLPCNRVQVYKSLSHIQKRMDVATGPHALRHTFISAAEKTGGGAVARDLANHKSLVITNRYDHSNREQRTAAVNSLPWATAR